MPGPFLAAAGAVLGGIARAAAPALGAAARAAIPAVGAAAGTVARGAVGLAAAGARAGGTALQSGARVASNVGARIESSTHRALSGAQQRGAQQRPLRPHDSRENRNTSIPDNGAWLAENNPWPQN